jgi:hypothetical protein
VILADWNKKTCKLAIRCELPPASHLWRICVSASILRSTGLAPLLRHESNDKALIMLQRMRRQWELQ